MKSLARRLGDFVQKLNHSPRRTRVYLCVYTALFLLCALVGFFHFLWRGKSFVWCGNGGNFDGISQHYIALNYWGTYLRDIVRTLFTEGRLSIPLYDTSIGLGGDVIQTLSYYVVGDPLNLLSALVPRAYTEYLYNFLILARLYLAGLSFSALMLHFKKNNRFYTLLASMVYLYTGYSLYAAVRHPYFSNPMIYFPLVLLGVEYILEGKKPWLFILSVTLAGLSNFYFFYMICLLTVIYVLVRLPHYCPKGQRSKMVGYLLRFALYGVLAVMMAGFLLYPSIRVTLASSRQGTGGSLPVLYGLNHYLNYIYAMGAAVGLGDWDFHGHLPLSLVAVFLLWMTPRNENKTQKRLFLLCTLFLSFPVFGWILNGTAYVSNRWVWAYNLLIAGICALRLPALADLPKKKWGWLIGGAALYATGALILELDSTFYFTALVGVVVTVLTLLLVRFFCEDVVRRRRYMALTLLILTVVQVADLTTARFHRAGYADDFIPLGQCYNNVLEAQAAPLNNLGDESYYRYEDCFEGDISRQKNAALVNGGHSTNAYFSLASDDWYALMRSVGHSDIMMQQQLGLDSRTVIGALAGVKYYTVRQGRATGTLPYGYNEEPLFSANIKNSNLYRGSANGTEPATRTYLYYQNEHALPFGYTYSSYITREEYDRLSYIDRQKALLNHAVLEAPSDRLVKGALPTATADTQIEITWDKTITVSGDVFTTRTGGNIYITLKNAEAERETYLSVGHLEYKELSPLEEAKLHGYWAGLVPQKKLQYLQDSALFTPEDEVRFTAAMNNTIQKFEYYTPAHTYYAGVHDYCINMGYYKTAPEQIVLTLPLAGQYTLQDIAVTQLDFEGYEAKVAALAEEPLENVAFADNQITGTITVAQDKLLCIPLPYSPGWTAYVDGQPTEICKTDLAFMGIELAAGEHTVELRYFTPYLGFGILLSGLGWSIFIIWFLIDLRKRKQKEGSK